MGKPDRYLTVDEAMGLIRQLVDLKRAAGKHCTIPIEVALDELGHIKDVWYAPPRVRLRSTLAKEA